MVGSCIPFHCRPWAQVLVSCNNSTIDLYPRTGVNQTRSLCPASSFGHGCGQFPPWHHHRWNARYGAPFPTISGPAGTTFRCSKSHSRVTPDLETMCPRVWPHRWVQPTDEFVPLVMTPLCGNPCRACQNYHVVKCCWRNHEIAHTDPELLQILGTFSHRVPPLGHMS